MNSLSPFQHPEIVLAVLCGAAGVIWIARRGMRQRTGNVVVSDRARWEMVRAFTASLDLDEVGQMIVQYVYGAIPLRAVSLYRWEASQRQLHVVAHIPGRTSALLERLGDGQEPTIQTALVSQQAADLVLTQGQPQPVMVLPLVVQGQAAGLLAVWPEPGHVLTSEERRLANEIAQQAAPALHNAATYTLTDATLRERVIELSTIEVVSRHISATLDIEIITSDVLAAAMSAIDAERGSCALVSSEQHYALVSRFDERGTQLEVPHVGSIGQDIISYVLRTGQPVIVPGESGYHADTTAFPSRLCVPILREEKPIGALSFEDTRPHVFTEAHLRFVTMLAEHAAVALENARLFSERHRQIETLVNLRKLSLELLAGRDLPSVINTVVDHAQNITHAADVCLYLWDEGGLNLAARYAHGTPSCRAADEQPIVVRQVIETGQPHYSEPIPAQPVYYPLKPAGFEALVCVPIRRTGQPTGVLAAVFTDPHYYTQNEMQTLELLANQAAVAIDNTRLYEAVRTGRDQLQAILDSTREAVLLFDRDGRLLKFNPAAEDMVGYVLAPYQGQGLLTWLRTMGAARLKTQTGFTLRHLRQYMLDVRHHPTRVIRRQFEQARQGETRFIIETGSPVLDQAGELAGWLLVWRDNTEERKLEMVRQELSSMIVHDLRNPITSITNSLKMLKELLDEGATETDMINEVLEIAQTSAGNMLNLVQSLLDVARLEHDSMALQCASLPLVEAIDDALAAVMGLSMGSGVEIVVDLDADLPPVWIDDEKIQRVLVNLLDNALRHTPYGGLIHIEAHRCLDENAVLVRVVDSGSGIPPEARSCIFDKFTQLDHQSLRGHKGTGLGLTFCKLAVEVHGGRIWVEDGEGTGAAFCFTLPVAPEHHNLSAGECR